MTTLATLVVEIVSDITGLMDGLNDASDNVGSFSDRAVNGLSALGGGIVVGGLAAAGAGVTALGLAMKDWVTEASASQGIAAQTEAVIKSTGGAAGMTADAISNLATSLSQVAPFEDDVIASGENMLLTFTNIGKDVFPATTQVMLDMSQALGQDITSSAMQLGKALNDPITGVTALARVGVTFTEEQKAMIKAMAEGGDVAGAQTLILAELTKEFGGSAAAAGQTFAGSLTILQNEMGNIKESMGTALLPALTELVEKMSEFANKPEFQQFLSDAASAISAFALQVVTYLPMIASAFQAGFDWLMQNQGVIVAALAVIGASLVAFAYTSLTAAIASMGAFLVASWPVIAVIAAIGAAAYLLYTAWTEDWGGIQEITSTVMNFIQDAISTGLQFISDLTNGNLGWLSEVWNTTTSSIMAVVDTWFSNIQLLFAAFSDAFSGDWSGFGENLRLIWDNNWNLLSTLAMNGFDNFKTMIGGLITTVIDIFKTTDWGEVGMNIIQGIAQGITFATQWLIESNINTLQAVLDAIKGFLGIASPSTVFQAEIGWQMGAGVMEGWNASVDQMLTVMPASMGQIVPAISGATSSKMSSIASPSSQNNSSKKPDVVVNYTDNTMFSLSDKHKLKYELSEIIREVVWEMREA